MKAQILGLINFATGGRNYGRQHDVMIMTVVLAFGVVAWTQWVHASVLEVHHESSGGRLFHLVRDGSLTLLPAFLAVVGGLSIAARLARRRSTRDTLVPNSVAIAALFGVLLVPLVAAHSVVDGVLGGDGGLGTIRTPPGAGYLVAGAGGLESATGFWGQLGHGARDALVAMPVALVLVLVTSSVIAWRVLEREGVIRASTSTTSPGSPVVAAVATSGITKRELLTYSGGGAAALALSSTGLIVLSTRQAHAAEASPATPWLSENIELFMNDGIINMIEGVPVYFWGWGFRSGGVDESEALNTPGPVLWTHHGDTITLQISNNLSEDHSFFIEGVVDSGVIAPGATREVSFPAPSPGTYLYQDGLNRPVNRALGLNGVLIVMPSDGSLVAHPDLDSEYWTFVTQWVWIFNEIDPAYNARAQAGLPIDPDEFVRNFLPRYFTLNGRMGSVASHEESAPETVIHAQLDHAALIRVVNAGVAMHAPHFHGNHVFPLVHNAAVPDTIMWKDTLRLMPEDRIDVFLPYAIPPNAVHFPPPEEGSAFLRELHQREMEGRWPMHCHVEMSQIAAGGLYPQGLLTDWKMEL